MSDELRLEIIKQYDQIIKDMTVEEILKGDMTQVQREAIRRAADKLYSPQLAEKEETGELGE